MCDLCVIFAFSVQVVNICLGVHVCLSGGSVFNMYTEEEDDDETGGLALGQPSLENSITMNKMKLLKAKMEDMNLNKKVDGFYFLVLSLGCHYSLSINMCHVFGHAGLIDMTCYSIKSFLRN